MKNARVETVVRIKVSEVASEIGAVHGIAKPLTSATIEEDTLVLRFSDLSVGPPGIEDRSTAEPLRSHEPAGTTATVTPSVHLQERRRRAGKRNRMRTRGWNIVTKIQNSHGQTAAIYEPFVKVLRGMTGPRRAKEKVVAEILRSNGNRPGPDSVKYFLENTLEFLAREAIQ